METIKRGTTPDIPVFIDGLAMDQIANIEFIFKARPTENAMAYFTKSYPDGGVTLDESGTAYVVALTEEDTRKLSAKSEVYMDTRITTINGKVPQSNWIVYKVEDTGYEG